MNKPVFKLLLAGLTALFFVACTTSLPVEDDEISDGWSWNVPKKARMNPDYDYGTMIDTRDNKTYMTVTIGEQTWMAENLNYADSVATPSLKGRSWCFKDVAANCEVTGRLYTWAAAMDSVKTGCGDDMKCSLKSPVQGICPDGWHLPDSTDWRVLFKVLGPDSVSFSALPGGYRHFYEGFLEDGRYAYFWCSTDRIGGINANYMDLCHFDTVAFLEYGYKVNGYSVRCLRNSF